jgi:outer membrane receptor protein involved in Fe transport
MILSKTNVSVILLFIPILLYSQSGKIHGVVSDQKTKEPLVGANIVVEGMTIGGATDLDGAYTIINIPVGTYSLRVSFVGYKSMRVTNVNVSQNLTTEQHVALPSSEVEVQTVEIVAERPLVNKDYTNTLRVSTAEELSVLPTRTITDAVGLQASVVKDEGSNNLHFRGGRMEEVGVSIDGVAVNDDFFGGQSNIFNMMNENAVEQLQVETGGFNAEYGSAMSGRIGVTTRTASARYTASTEIVTDAFLSPEVGKSGGWGYNTYSATLGGPVLPTSDVATFFIAGERIYLGDNDPRAIGGYKPNTSTQGWTMNGKLGFQLSKTMDLKLGGIEYLREGQNWDNGTLFSRRFRFLNPQHNIGFNNSSISSFARLTHNVGTNMFYTAQVGYFNEKTETGDPMWWSEVENYGKRSLNPVLPSDGTNHDRTFSMWDTTGSVYNFYQRTNLTHMTAQADVSIQAESHLIKVGGEYRYYTMRNYYLNTPVQLAASLRGTNTYLDWERYRAQSVDYYGYTYDGTSENDVDDWWGKTTDAPREGPKHPIYAAFYAQDKIELADLVLNIGVRVDHFDAKETVVKDPYNFRGARGTSGDGVFDAGDVQNSEPYTLVSPRIGFSFPVTDKAVFHAHYGVFTQMPRLQDVLISKTYEEYMMSTNPYSTQIPNPNLKPERTIAYEVGFRQMITENAAFTVTGFYKEIKDLIQARNVGIGNQPAYPSGYETFENVDFGTVKGFDIIFDLRRTKNISMSVNYTYSYANGTGSNPNSQFRMTWTQMTTPKVIAPLDYDRRHNGSINIDFRTAANEGPRFAGLHPFENFGANLLFTFNSGVPYTPSNINNPFFGSQTEVRPIGGINSSYGPWNYRLDFRVDRTFTLSQLTVVASFYVINLTDTKNELTVFRGTGEADNTGWLGTPSGQVWAAQNGQAAVDMYHQMEQNPGNFGIPRQVRLGLRIEY